jgi:alkylation response protein AidB-like acyl-CoA dehydrogenase
VPDEFGGGGASLLDVASAQRAIAIVDPSLAIALNMHSFTIGLLREYWIAKKDISWFLLEGIAEKNALVASAFAEPAGLPNMLSANMDAVRSPKGYRLSGVKYPCSLVTSADIFCTNARVSGSAEIIVAMVPAKAPGLTADETWRGMGMRSSDTGRLTLSEVEVDERLVFYSAPADEIDDLVIAGIVWFAALLAASYHGAMCRLLSMAVQPKQSYSSERRYVLGRATRPVISLGFSCQGVARAWDDGSLGGTAALAAAQALRNQVAAAADDVVREIRLLVGSRLYTRGDELGELGLDLIASHHHPPAELICDFSLGGIALGDSGTLGPVSPKKSRH